MHYRHAVCSMCRWGVRGAGSLTGLCEMVRNSLNSINTWNVASSPWYSLLYYNIYYYYVYYYVYYYYVYYYYAYYYYLYYLRILLLQILLRIYYNAY